MRSYRLKVSCLEKLAILLPALVSNSHVHLCIETLNIQSQFYIHFIQYLVKNKMQ